jgi:hypothetical protein
MSVSALGAGSPYGVEQFGAALMTVSQSALPYIGAGVTAAVLVLGVVMGIRAGLRLLFGTADGTEPGAIGRAGADGGWELTDEEEQALYESENGWGANAEASDDYDAWVREQDSSPYGALDLDYDDTHNMVGHNPEDGHR